MLDVANDIGRVQQFPRYSLQEVYPKVRSAFIQAKKIGLWSPDDRIYQINRGGDVLMDYLRNVGRLLADGHFTEAEQTALQIKGAFAEIVAKSEETKQVHKVR
jgi:hypothetical protein